MKPAITVIMPVFNCDRFVADAVHSILDQTFTDFELLVIDDGSTDQTVEVVRQCTDPRLRVISSGSHVGIAAALNLGISQAQGKYIARMDGDDTCHRERFERQFTYMESHPDVVLCGTNMRLFGSDRTLSLPSGHESIRAHLLFSNCISHPTVLIRNHSFLYSTVHPYAEDYALWATMIETGRFHNLPDTLYTWRIHDRQVSALQYTTARVSGAKIHRDLLTRFGVPFSEQELDLHTHFQHHIGEVQLEHWLDKLLLHNESHPYYDHAKLQRVIEHIRQHDYVLI